MEQKTKAWNTSIPADIGKVAGILTAIRDALNVCLGAARALANIKGTGGIVVKVAGANIVIDASEAFRTINEAAEEYGRRTFYVRHNGGTSAKVSAGVINNVIYAGGTLTGLANGNKIYIDATVTTDTDTVLAVTVSSGASTPTSSATHAYTTIAEVLVSGGIATITPVAWNYSQLQLCGTFRWGGFGS